MLIDNLKTNLLICITNNKNMKKKQSINKNKEVNQSLAAKKASL